MQILADRLKQNYPDCRQGEMSEEMNLKRPLFYQNGTDLKKNKVYIAKDGDIPKALLKAHGDNLLLITGSTSDETEENLIPGVCFFPEGCDQNELFNTVQRIFDTYDAWDERMQNLALSARTFKSLLDASHRIFLNPIMISTTGGFIIDYSSLMDTLPEFQGILQNNQVTACRDEEAYPHEISEVRQYQDPSTQKNNLFVDI